jgi:outer membrane protein assembly factor BamB
VIVSADSAAAAASAVQRVGGQVTSSLRLIDAVAADVPAARLAQLSSASGIVAIVANRGVKTADWNGWASNRRIVRQIYTLGDTQSVPAINLPDGGFFVLTLGGRVQIFNPDGAKRAQIILPSGGPFSSAPALGPNGTVFVAGVAQTLYALGPDGAIRWRYAPAGRVTFVGGAVLSLDGATVYVADKTRKLYALDAATGALRWASTPGSIGVPLAAPGVGPDGTIYLATDKGLVYALRPDGSTLWSANTAVTLNLVPVVGSTGSVYVASTQSKKLIALSSATGAVQFSFTSPGAISDEPTVGPDGSLYIAASAGLYHLSPGGAQLFYAPAVGGSFLTSPLLSADGAMVYAATNGKNFMAFDAASGAQRWMFTFAGRFVAAPVMASDGTLVLGSDAAELAFLSSDGTVLSRLTLSDKITQTPLVTTEGSVAVRVGNSDLQLVGRMADKWDGTPDVIQNTGCSWPNNINASCWYWKTINPVNIDIGADTVQATTLPSGKAITGEGVNITVIDSGFYADPYMVQHLGSHIPALVQGQYDFIDRVCETGSRYAIQGDGYCYRLPGYTRDGYGHGTHVSSIINDPLKDLDTGVILGVAPSAKLINVRVLDNDGNGSYANVIAGIQYIVENKAQLGVRVMNLSLSAQATMPYFVDPINRAVEQAWASGIVVLAAAGNSGPGAETVTVPGNDPYVITVGAVNTRRTPGYWANDVILTWSGNGPTADGFVKPDILAPGSQVVGWMYNNSTNPGQSQKLARIHPDFSANASLFRMNGTSMATAVASGVAALMLQANPALTPDQVKYRMMTSARAAVDAEGVLTYNLFQQGTGRIWAPDAVLGNFPTESANAGMNISADLAAGYATDADMAAHYQGPVSRVLSDDGQTYLYYATDADGTLISLGARHLADGIWLTPDVLANGRMTWSVGRMTWSVGRMTWSVGRMTWSVGGDIWEGGLDLLPPESLANARASWAAGASSTLSTTSTSWANDE